MKTINSTRGIYYCVIPNYKLKLLVHRNITALKEGYDRTNGLLNSDVITIQPRENRDAKNSFRLEIRTHFSLLFKTPKLCNEIF